MMIPEPAYSIPVFRSFDETLARAFYVDWLGFSVELEHRMDATAPLYLGLSLGGIKLHLSEHHGECSPGGLTMIWLYGLTEWHKTLLAKPYANNRPGLVQHPYGLTMTVNDPFYNRIRFVEAPATE